MKPSAYIIIAAIFCVIFFSCEKASEVYESGKTVKIGVIAPLSGPDSEIGKNGLAGIEAALALYPYLLNGDKIELKVEDEKSNVGQTKMALYKLAEIEKVAAILIFSRSEAVLAVAEEAQYYKTPILSLIATHPDVVNDWLTQFFFDDHIQATVAALFVLDELLIDKVAVIEDLGDPHSTYLAKQFTHVFKAAGGLVEKKTITRGKVDFRGTLTSLKTRGINFCYLPLQSNEVLEFEKQAREIDFHPQVMVSDGVLSSIRLQAEDDLDIIDEMFAVDVYAANIPFTPFGRKLAANYQRDISRPGTTFSALGAEGAYFLTIAMDRCGDSSNRKCINRMLRNDEYLEGIFGNIRIRSDGKTERPVYINKIEGENLEFVVKIN